jgi:hypothetical protein
VIDQTKRTGRAAPESAIDPFDPASLRLSQDFTTEIGVKKVLTRVPVRRPYKQDFVRVHPDPRYALDTASIELKDDGEWYLVAPAYRAPLAAEIKPVRLYTAITRQGALFLWPCRLVGPDGRSNPWFDTLLEAAELAKSRWVRVVADRNLGGYQAYAALDELSDPDWPAESLQQLLRVAFRDRYIDSIDHPVLKRLQGRL